MATTTNTTNNGWERIAKKNIKAAYNDIIGSWENAVQDEQMTEEEFEEAISDTNDVVDYVYREAITTQYGPGWSGGKAPKEMRFAGKQFCLDYIKSLLKKDGYLKETTTSEIATVELKAFTGMSLGEYQAVKSSKGFTLTTKKGACLEFDLNGVQTNANNVKFANRIEMR